MKKILGLVGSLVGLFIGSILFFLSLNGMLRTKSPFLVAGPGYTAAASLSTEDQADTATDIRSALDPRKLLPSKRLDEIEDASPKAPATGREKPEAPAASSKDKQGQDKSKPQRSSANTSPSTPSSPPEPDVATQVATAEKEHEAKVLQLEAEKLERLVRVYEKMKPKQVALIMETLPDDQSVLILANMKDRAAAQVMAGMEPQKAARMSRLLVKRGGK